MMAQLPTELFTWTSLGTFTGLTGATVVVTNTAARAFDWSPRWLGLVVAVALCVGVAIARQDTFADYVLALLNGCLVYLTAAGTSSAGATTTDHASGGALEEMGRTASHPFFRRWF
jgi:hypothetical protein